MLAAEKRQYKAGMAARKREVVAAACPFGVFQMRLRSWWLAGWHDADMEAGQKMTDGITSHYKQGSLVFGQAIY